MKKKLLQLMIAMMIIGTALTSCIKEDPEKEPEATEEETEQETTGCTDATVPLHTFKLGETSYQVTGSGTSITGIPGYRLVLYQSGSMVMTIMMNAKPTTGTYTLEPLTGTTQPDAGKAQFSVQTYKSDSGTMCITVSGTKATVIMNNINTPSQIMGSPSTLSAYFEVTLNN